MLIVTKYENKIRIAFLGETGRHLKLFHGPLDEYYSWEEGDRVDPVLLLPIMLIEVKFE
jgi:hypothetical protein